MLSHLDEFSRAVRKRIQSIHALILNILRCGAEGDEGELKYLRLILVAEFNFIAAIEEGVNKQHFQRIHGPFPYSFWNPGFKTLKPDVDEAVKHLPLTNTWSIHTAFDEALTSFFPSVVSLDIQISPWEFDFNETIQTSEKLFPGLLIRPIFGDRSWQQEKNDVPEAIVVSVYDQFEVLIWIPRVKNLPSIVGASSLNDPRRMLRCSVISPDESALNLESAPGIKWPTASSFRDPNIISYRSFDSEHKSLREMESFFNSWVRAKSSVYGRLTLLHFFELLSKFENFLQNECETCREVIRIGRGGFSFPVVYRGGRFYHLSCDSDN